jgi:hypothetical protein
MIQFLPFVLEQAPAKRFRLKFRQKSIQFYKFTLSVPRVVDQNIAEPKNNTVSVAEKKLPKP